MARRPTPPLPTDPVVTLPPLNSGVIVQLEASGPIPPPSADILTISPGASAAISSLNVPRGPTQYVPQSARPSSGLRPWSLTDWFTVGPQDMWAVNGPSLRVPPVSKFDLAIACLFARIAYYATAQNDIAPALAQVLGLVFSRVVIGPTPINTADLWVLDGNRIVVALPGTTTYAQWSAYATASLRGVSRPWLPVGSTAWAGLVTSYEAISAGLSLTLEPWLSQPESIVLVGHSGGGAWAQMAACQLSSQAQIAAESVPANSPVIAQYTFGAPAWWYRNATVGFFLGLAGHVRVHAYGDPVTEITQYLSRAYSLLPPLQLPVAVSGTSHIEDLEIGLTNPGDNRARALVSSGMAAALGGPASLAAVLSQRHSVAMYQRSTATAAALARDTPDPEYGALSTATAELDALDGV